jgi:acetyltransferase-like isoleucine patch superfamily enzyme
MANHFHPSAVIHEAALIDVSSRGTHTYIGEGSVLDAWVRIKHVGGIGDVRIGRNSYLNSGCVLYSGNGIEIGDDVLIGPNCSLVPVNHAFATRSMPIRLQRFQASRGGLVIANDVWLGAGVTVLDGARIASGCVIAAGSVVAGATEAFGIYAGTPARLIRMREP